MQLFSIGLVNLNLDGSPKVSAGNGQISTYDNDQIMAFARVWTGLTRDGGRENRERPFDNQIDPMIIKYDWHDFLPKIDLNGGHLADGYPLCADHPRAFLVKGARYHYTGEISTEGVEFDVLWSDPERPRFVPSNTSSLFKALCKRDSKTGKCTFPSLVVLPETLPCHGTQECNAENVRVVKIVNGNQFGYFTLLPPACARLTFFNGVMTYTSEFWNKYGPPQCTDPTSTVVASAACCDTISKQLDRNYGKNKCLFIAETMSLNTAKKRCATENLEGAELEVCPNNVFSRKFGSARRYSCSDNGYIWTTESCQLQVKVFASGKVAIVSPATKTSKHTLTRFMVHWEPSESDDGSRFPAVSSGCGPGCKFDKAQGGSCLCNVTVTDHTVYTDIKKIPTAETLLSTLFIGAPAPSDEPGVYTRCKSCAQQADVTVYIRGSNASPTALEQTAVFAINSGKAKVTYLLNRLSMVGVGESSDGSTDLYTFRNPPNLMPGVGEEWIDHDIGWKSRKFRKDMVTNEIDALIDHVFYHDNTAVFVARKLIMRLVTSNPSPRYVKTVSTAFRTGSYAGHTFSGKYGDLKATVYAVLLDREARASMLEYDRTFGRVREPLLKLLQVMRVLEFQSRDEREVKMTGLGGIIGQQIFTSETVFNFFDDDFDALGPMFTAGLVAPESQLLTAPQTIAWLNGMTSLVTHGLSACRAGFGEPISRQTCGILDIAVKQSDGWLTFAAASPDDPAAALEELSLLLTSGRLTPQHRSVIQQAYAQVLKTEGKKAALQRAVKLILFSAEFHSTAMNIMASGSRPVGPPEASHDRKFKAVVVLFLAGGAGSYYRKNESKVWEVFCCSVSVLFATQIIK